MVSAFFAKRGKKETFAVIGSKNINKIKERLRKKRLVELDNMTEAEGHSAMVNYVENNGCIECMIKDECRIHPTFCPETPPRNTERRITKWSRTPENNSGCLVNATVSFPTGPRNLHDVFLGMQ
jgi:hypothetical protein